MVIPLLPDHPPPPVCAPQVRIDEVDEQWCGSLHVGLTTLAPPELPSCPLSSLSPCLPQLRSKVTWMLCGSQVQRNGALQRQNYCCSLDRLTASLGGGGGCCGCSQGANTKELNQLLMTISKQ